MNFEIKDYPDQDTKMLIKSLELVSARLFESLITINQTACANTPEMSQMFNEWVSCMGDEIERCFTEERMTDPAEIAKKIGVSPATVMSLALTLHREGKITIKAIEAEKGNGTNREICGCMKCKD